MWLKQLSDPIPERRPEGIYDLVMSYLVDSLDLHQLLQDIVFMEFHLMKVLVGQLDHIVLPRLVVVAFIYDVTWQTHSYILLAHASSSFEVLTPSDAFCICKATLTVVTRLNRAIHSGRVQSSSS